MGYVRAGEEGGRGGRREGGRRAAGEEGGRGRREEGGRGGRRAGEEGRGRREEGGGRRREEGEGGENVESDLGEIMQIRVNVESECWREMKRLLARMKKISHLPRPHIGKCGHGRGTFHDHSVPHCGRGRLGTFHDHTYTSVVVEGAFPRPHYYHIIKCGREKSPPGQLFTCYATAFFLTTNIGFLVV